MDDIAVMTDAPITPRAKLLESHWFQCLPFQLQDSLANKSQVIHLSDGTVLFRRGDPFCGIYAVLAGSIAVGNVDIYGKEALLSVLAPVSWFGEISLFDGLPRSHDAVAIKSSTMIKISSEAIRQILEDSPVYWREFGMLLTAKTRLSFDNLEKGALLSTQQRVASRLLLIAEGYDGASNPQGIIEISQERLSTLLSISRRTANQALRRLQELGALRITLGKITVINIDELRRWSSRGADGS